MESYLKDQWYQLDEQYRNEEYRNKKQLKIRLEKKNADKHINNKRRKSKRVGNIVFDFI
jgi:hypothetical protein